MDKFLSAFREGKNEKRVTQATNFLATNFPPFSYYIERKQLVQSCQKITYLKITRYVMNVKGNSGHDQTWSEVHANSSWSLYDAISILSKTFAQCSLRKLP